MAAWCSAALPCASVALTSVPGLISLRRRATSPVRAGGTSGATVDICSAMIRSLQFPTSRLRVAVAVRPASRRRMP